MYEVEQDGRIGEREKAREQEDTDRLEWNKRANEIVRDRKLYRNKEIGAIKRMQKQVMGKSKKKMLTEVDKNKKAKNDSCVRENKNNLNINKVNLDVDYDMQVGSIVDEREKEAGETEVYQTNEMDIEEVIGTKGSMLPTIEINTSQDNYSKGKENKENGKGQSRENRDRMILRNGVMQYEDRDKGRNIDENNNNNFRFKGDHKGSIIVGASVRREKIVKGKIGNAVRIATKTMAISNKIIKIKHLGYNRSEIHIKDVVTANKILDLKESDIEYYVPGRAKRIKGVLIDWDSELPLHELYEAMTETERRGIIQIERLKKRIYNREKQESLMIDTNNLVMTWEGNARPDKISLCGGMMSLRVRPFVEAVRQCFNCFKFGHVKAVCRAKQRCIVCGEEGIHGRCEKPLSCTSCGEAHKSTDRRCNVYQYNMELKKVMAENNVSLREAEGILKIDIPKKLPRVINIRTWPEIKIRNNLTFEDQRKRGMDMIGIQKKSGKAMYSEVLQRQEQNVGEENNECYEGYSEEEEERKVMKNIRRKKDKEQREKRIQEYNEYRRSVNVREEETLKGKRGVVIEYQRNEEEEITGELKQDRENKNEDIEKRIQKMEEVLNKILEFMNKMLTDRKEEEKEERDDQREKKRCRKEES